VLVKYRYSSGTVDLSYMVNGNSMRGYIQYEAMLHTYHTRIELSSSMLEANRLESALMRYRGLATCKLRQATKHKQ
jgi:hypothetical protein